MQPDTLSLAALHMFTSLVTRNNPHTHPCSSVAVQGVTCACFLSHSILSKVVGDVDAQSTHPQDRHVGHQGVPRTSMCSMESLRSGSSGGPDTASHS